MFINKFTCHQAGFCFRARSYSTVMVNLVAPLLREVQAEKRVAIKAASMLEYDKLAVRGNSLAERELCVQGLQGNPWELHTLVSAGIDHWANRSEEKIAVPFVDGSIRSRYKDKDVLVHAFFDLVHRKVMKIEDRPVLVAEGCNSHDANLLIQVWLANKGISPTVLAGDVNLSALGLARGTVSIQADHFHQVTSTRFSPTYFLHRDGVKHPVVSSSIPNSQLLHVPFRLPAIQPPEILTQWLKAKVKTLKVHDYCMMCFLEDHIDAHETLTRHHMRHIRQNRVLDVEVEHYSTSNKRSQACLFKTSAIEQVMNRVGVKVLFLDRIAAEDDWGNQAPIIAVIVEGGQTC